MQRLKKKEEESVDLEHEKQINVPVLEEPILIKSEDSRMLKKEVRKMKVKA